MFALVFAVISLSNIDPDPIVTPTPAIHDRFTGASGFAPGLPDAGLSADVGGAPCGFGTPQFGSDLWADANALTRTLAMPACTANGFTGYSSSGFSPYGSAYGSVYGFSPAGYVSRWLPVAAIPGNGPAFHAPNVPARIVAAPAPVFHVPPAQPFVVRARSMPVVAPQRHH